MWTDKRETEQNTHPWTRNMDVHHTPGTAIDVFVEFVLYRLHCLFHMLELILYHVFTYCICLNRIVLKGGPELLNFEDLCLVNVNVKYFRKLCFTTRKFQLNWNIWKPSLKSSPLDFSQQRRGNTSLVVFLQCVSTVIRTQIQRIKVLEKYPVGYFAHNSIVFTTFAQTIIFSQILMGLVPRQYFVGWFEPRDVGTGVNVGSYPFPVGIKFSLVSMRKPIFFVARDQASIPGVNRVLSSKKLWMFFVC